VLAHPLWPVLTSMPGVGVRTAARLLTEVAHKAFASAAHLAAYAGLAPVTRRSGSYIRGEHPSRRGNKVLKRALFLSAFAALRDPVSRAYYARKIQQGKRHNQALIALTRRRCDVLFAMLRDGTIYQFKSAPTLDEGHRGAPRPHRACLDRTGHASLGGARCRWDPRCVRRANRGRARGPPPALP